MKQNRLYEIERYISERDSVPLTELCAHFDISLSTLRRDLDKLGNRIIKTYGHASIAAQNREDSLLHARRSLYTQEKKKIAQIAANLIEDKDIIFVDSGSTTGLLADYIDPSKRVTIITNNLDVLIRGMQHSHLEIYVLPGKLNRNNNCFSYLTDDNLYSSYNIGKVFMSCSGIDLTYGISHKDVSERIAKRYAINRTTQRYLLVDSTKFNQVFPLYLCAIERFGTICTNERPSDAYVEYCRAHNVRLLYEL